MYRPDGGAYRTNELFYRPYAAVNRLIEMWFTIWVVGCTIWAVIQMVIQIQIQRNIIIMIIVTVKVQRIGNKAVSSISR